MQSDYFNFHPFETMDAFMIACEGGSSEGCERARKMRSGKYYSAKKGYSTLKSACKDDDGPSCLAQGLWDRHGLGTKTDFKDARENFDRSCRLGHLPGCFMKNQYAGSELLGPRYADAMGDLCIAGLDAGCMAQTQGLYIEVRTSEVVHDARLEQFVNACERRAGICKFDHVVTAMATPERARKAERLAALAGPNSRTAIERELLKRTREAAQTGRSAPAVVGVIMGFNAQGVPIVSPDLVEAASGVPDVLAALLDGGASQDALNVQGRPAILNAANNGQASAVKLLLEKGVSPDVRNADDVGWTPLQLAVIENHPEVVAALLAGGADPSFANNFGSDPLMSAAKRGRIEMIRMLIDSGASLWSQDTTETALSALHHAAMNDQIQAVGLLIREGAKPNLVDGQGQTALHYAVENGHTDTALMLIEQGADINRPFNETGQSLLDRAVETGNAVLAQSLLAAGADPNQTDNDGETPLFAAIRSGDETLANVLLDAGADPTIISRNGTTPRSIYREMEAQRAEAERVAEAQRQARLEAERQARIKAQRQAELRRQREAAAKAKDNKNRNGFLGTVFGAAAGAVIGTEMGLEGGQITEFANTMGTIGRAAATGDAADGQAAVGSVNSLESRLNVARGSSVSALSGGTYSGTSLNQRTQSAAAKEGYQTYDHTFSCDVGGPKTISVPYKTQRQLDLRKKLAESSACNRMSESQAVQNQCNAEFGNPYCQ